MTSLKKTLIATASAVALLATTLVAAPANAAVATTLTVAGSAAATAGTSEATAVVLPVPADNSVDSTDAVEFAIAGITAGDTVTVVATDATLVKAGTTGTITANTGEASLSIPTGTGTTASFKAYTKTTKVGKIAVTVGSAAAVNYYVKGTAGSLNSISVVAPTAALGTVAKATVTGLDVFGNPVSGSSVALQVISGTATNTYSLTTTTDGTAVKELSGLSVDTYDLIATATVATAVTGLAAPVGFVKGQLKVVDLTAIVAGKDAELTVANGKVTALTAEKAALAAQVADLTAKLAAAEALATTNKTKFNNLAKRWNVKFPKAKATLIK